MKLKKVNKVLSITLASAMLVSSVPVNTFADEKESELSTEQAEKKEEKAVKTDVGSSDTQQKQEATGDKQEAVNPGNEEKKDDAQEPANAGDLNNRKDNPENTPGDGKDDPGNTPGDGKDDPGNTPGDGKDDPGNTPGDGKDDPGNTPGDGKDDPGNTPGDGKDDSGNIPGDGKDDSGNKPGSKEDDKKVISYSVTWNYTEPYTYNGKEQVPAATVKGVDADKYEVNYYRTENGTDTPVEKKDCVNAGEYKAEVVITDTDANTTYELETGSLNQSFKITKKQLSLGKFTSELPYNGEAQTPEIKFKDVAGNEVAFDVKTIGLTAGEQAIATGSYQAEVSLPEGYDKNYKFETTKVDYEIVKAVAHVQWTETEAFYDGTAKRPAAVIEYAENHTAAGKVILYNGENEQEECINAGDYIARVQLPEDAAENYKLDEKEAQTIFKIKQSGVIVEWTGDSFVYNGAYQAPTATVTIKDGANKETTLDERQYRIEVTKKVDDTSEAVSENSPMGAGSYTATVKLNTENYKALDDSVQMSKDFTVEKRGVRITASPQTKVYGTKDPEFTYEVENEDLVDTDKSMDLTADFNDALASKLENKSLLSRDTSAENESVKAEGYEIGCNIEELDNYTINYTPSKLTITPLPITVKPTPDQSKYYGEKDPEVDGKVAYKYTVAIGDESITRDTFAANMRDGFIQENETPEEAIAAELGDQILTRKPGENAGTYAYSYVGTNGNYTVPAIAEDAPTFKIKPLQITITPKKNQGKLYGEKDPKSYGYDVTVNVADFAENMREDFVQKEDETPEEAIAAELGDQILERAKGENPDKYAYNYKREDANPNYEVPDIDKDASKFEIKKLSITVPEKIGSRESEFTVKTNLSNKKRAGDDKDVSTGDLSDAQTYIVAEVEKWPDDAEIEFPTGIDQYIENAEEGIGFSEEAPVIDIRTVSYTNTKKGQSWEGMLPAGTILKITVVNVKDGKMTEVSNTATMTVTKQAVSLGSWGTYLGTSADGRNFIKNGTALTNKLNSENEELVEITYKSNAKSDKATETVYAFSHSEKPFSYEPKINNEASTHVTQSLTASIVDTLNLTCESKSDTFYVDNEAFKASTVEFKNRATEMTITLPEYGIIKSVDIAGATVTLSGEKEKQFTLPVKWSGKELVTSGSGIKVTYEDEAGNIGEGTGTVARSSVSTPIRFKIKPELNGAGYLNGRSSTLLISGTACACEQIRVSVAGSTQTTYATQKETWSDENGSWEVAVPMNGLPEGEDFEISAEYVDVDGAGYTMTAKYNAFCADTAVLSPIYEAMTRLSGMVEPQTTMALVLNGETQEYYEIEVDRFGHFVLDDVPMLFAGESFDIYVTDIAGNQSITHYEIPEPEDPFEIKSTVNPLGKFFYFGERSGSESYLATPVAAGDFTDQKDRIELPLLMGASYEVGTLTLQKTENGFTVSSELQISEDIDPEDYKVENEKLYVYTSRPTLDDFKNHTGQEYAYGEEIPLGENETVWIVDQKDMTILADSILDLDAFQFDKSEEYEAYQER